jgi:AAA ATPase-like protein
MLEPLDKEPIMGRRKELARLAAAVETRQPLLIHGPADAGKTFLVLRLLDSLPVETRRSCVYVSGFTSIHALLQEVARQVFAPVAAPAGRGVRTAGHRERPARDLATSTSGRLRLLLRNAVRERRLCIFLDHAPRFSAAMARLAREWVWRDETSVYLVARGKTRGEIGYAWSLYFAPELRLDIGRLAEPEAKILLDRSIRRYGLAAFDSDEFRAGVLRLSRGLPGAIVKMCALTAQPRYHYGRQVKLRLLHVDYLMQGAAPQRAAAPGAER